LHYPSSPAPIIGATCTFDAKKRFLQKVIFNVTYLCKGSKNFLKNLALFKHNRFWITLICGFIVCGSLKSEGFGDGYAAFGVLPSPSCAHSTSLRAGFEAATQD